MDFQGGNLKEILEDFVSRLSLLESEDELSNSTKGNGQQPSKEILDALYKRERGILLPNLEKYSLLTIRYYISLFLSGKFTQFDLKDEFVKVRDSVQVLDPLLFLKKSVLKHKVVTERLVKDFEDDLYSITIKVFLKIENMILPFKDKVEVQFDINGDEYLFQVVKNLDFKFNRRLTDYFNALQLTISLSGLENFSFHAHETVLKELILLEKNFSELAIDPIDQVLKDAISTKVSFLNYKILKRIKLDNVSIKVENRKEEIFTESLISTLPLWGNFIVAHYGEGEKAKNAQWRSQRSIIDSNPEFYSFQNIHTAVKIYKDEIKSVEKLEKITSKLEGEKYTSKFDKYAVRVLKSYTFNNSISLKLKQRNLAYDDFVQLCDHVESFQNSDSLFNYHPWLKLSQRIIKFIDDQTEPLINMSLSEKSTKTDLINLEDGYTDAILLLERCFAKLRETMAWSTKHSYLAFQSPLNECLSSYSVDVENIGVFKLYFKSSYIIPISYSDISDQVKEVEDQLRSAKSFHKTHGFLTHMYSNIRDSNKELVENKNQIKQQERRAVEVLGIFAAIAMFSLGSIQIFKDNGTGMATPEILGFILVFAFGLSLFAYIIWIITRENLFNLHWYHLAIFVFYVVGFYLIYDFLTNPNPHFHFVF